VEAVADTVAEGEVGVQNRTHYHHIVVAVVEVVVANQVSHTTPDAGAAVAAAAAVDRTNIRSFVVVGVEVGAGSNLVQGCAWVH